MRPDLAEFTVERLCGSDEGSAEEASAQLAFLDGLQTWFREVGVAETIAVLNAAGHAFEDVQEAAAGWKIFREPGGDGKRELQVSVEDATGDILITTPLSDAAYAAMLAARRAPLGPEEQAREDLREQFYARGGELYVSRHESADSLEDCDRLLMTLYVLDMEINNGGFAQYFDNTGGRDAELAVELLTRIGAAKAADLVARAAALVGGPFGEALSAPQRAALDTRAESLDSLDDGWYALDEDIALLAMQHCQGGDGGPDR